MPSPLYSTEVVNAFRTVYDADSSTDAPPPGLPQALEVLQAEGYMEGYLWAGSPESYKDLVPLAFPDHPSKCTLLWFGRDPQDARRKVWRCGYGPTHQHSISMGSHYYVQD